MNTSTYDFNTQYLSKNNNPWFPIMGEIHYSRLSELDWEESLYKMKTGGVDVVSTYVLWIHHEEVEGEYDFSGNKNLHAFVQMVQRCGLSLILRIGPWCHAECRNGGFPDWILKKNFEVRTNHTDYFHMVEIYYKKIFEQVEGLLLKDGGPIIGIQIENEYGHCGGLQGEEGEKHMRTLYNIAKNAGFIVPLYTATGWGGAMTGGLLPVMGGYCEAPWDPRIVKLEPNGNYIFTYERNDHNIGSDYGLGVGTTFDIKKFPYLTAELGGGLQVTKHRRPIAHSKDIGAMSMVKMGSGVNLLGYYMFHGGTNPIGKLSTFQESKETGYPNDLPVLNYDFNGPIRQYGQISDTYKEIKLLTMFIKDFGEELCKMIAVIPENNPLNPKDLDHLRYAFRYNEEGQGYVFVNNYQKDYEMAEHKDVVLEIPLINHVITFPPVTVKDKDYFFYPFHMKLGNATLVTALATPLCKLNNRVVSYVFYTEQEPKYCIEGDLEDNEIITISRQEAKNAYKVMFDQEYLIITDSNIVKKEDKTYVIDRKATQIMVYPELNNSPEGYNYLGKKGVFQVYVRTVTNQIADVNVYHKKHFYEKDEFELTLSSNSSLENAYLKINYIGNTAKLYIDDQLVADHFYTGQTWEISLKHFNNAMAYRLEIEPLRRDTAVYLEKWPDIKPEGEATILSSSVEFEYKHELVGGL